MVTRLPPKESLNDGRLYSAETNTGTSDYYDGTTKLRVNAALSSCHTLDKSACLRKRECGWCGSSNSCITGNNLGPTSPCLSGTFLYVGPKIEQPSNISTATNYR